MQIIGRSVSVNHFRVVSFHYHAIHVFVSFFIYSSSFSFVFRWDSPMQFVIKTPVSLSFLCSSVAFFVRYISLSIVKQFRNFPLTSRYAIICSTRIVSEFYAFSILQILSILHDKKASDFLKVFSISAICSWSNIVSPNRCTKYCLFLQEARPTYISSISCRNSLLSCSWERHKKAERNAWTTWTNRPIHRWTARILWIVQASLVFEINCFEQS